MKKLFLILFVALCYPFVGWGAVFGYCDGKIANADEGYIFGLDGTNADIIMEIKVPAKTLKQYVGCKINTVQYGMPVSSGYPQSLTGWVSETYRGTRLCEGTITSMQKGWNDIKMTEPYTITGNETELWIGVEFKQASKLSIISFAGTTDENACYLVKNGLQDIKTSKNWGSLSIQAVLEGQTLTHNLSFSGVKAASDQILIGDPIKVSGKIENNASATAENPLIRYSLNGTEIGVYTYEGTLEQNESDEFSFDIPTESVPEPSSASVKLSLEWADGSEDEDPSDNVADFSVDMVNDRFVRRMVCEESTGSWCGFCVRGIVGLSEMKKLYPDDFIGIAVHNSDIYEVDAYDSYCTQFISGFPSSRINRSKVVDPSFANLKSSYLSMDKTCHASMKVDAEAVGNQITFHSHTTFNTASTATGYAVLFVLTEDECPLSQANYYSGGTYGTMGGFESMSNPAKVNVDDVARGIYPSTSSTSATLPLAIEAYKEYDYSYTTTLPTYLNKNNLHVVALLTSVNTGEIIQACMTDQIDGLTDGIEQSCSNRVTKAEQHFYNLLGQRVSSQKGLVIVNGKKIIK